MDDGAAVKRLRQRTYGLRQRTYANLEDVRARRKAGFAVIVLECSDLVSPPELVGAYWHRLESCALARARRIRNVPGQRAHVQKVADGTS